MVAYRVVVRGRVQGVGFRWFVRDHAHRLGVVGYVRNLPDGRSVEAHLQGEEEPVQELIRRMRQGPPGSRVEEVSVSPVPVDANLCDFRIVFF
ncbi:MAG: hypothetical protein KatS3mg115_0423 [Candidatus Poribacteria bacterium]|nr:MAG: hypothetical protein KatS3mg115_0423 [Candidatus Poribacteria bacterium]